MNNKNKIIASAKRTLSKEIKSIETLKKTLFAQVAWHTWGHLRRRSNKPLESARTPQRPLCLGNRLQWILKELFFIL